MSNLSSVAPLENDIQPLEALSALHRLSAALNHMSSRADLSLDAALRLIVDGVVQLVPGASARIVLYDRSPGVFESASQVPSSAAHTSLGGARPRESLCFPLVAAGRPIGALHLLIPDELALAQSARLMLEILVSHAALVLSQARRPAGIPRAPVYSTPEWCRSWGAAIPAASRPRDSAGVTPPPAAASEDVSRPRDSADVTPHPDGCPAGPEDASCPAACLHDVLASKRDRPRAGHKLSPSQRSDGPASTGCDTLVSSGPRPGAGDHAPALYRSSAAPPAEPKGVAHRVTNTLAAEQAHDDRVSVAHTALSAAGAHGELDALTDREREVLVLLSEGLTNKQIAALLVITPNTVKRHLKSIFEKLGVRTRAAAAAKAISARFPAH